MYFQWCVCPYIRRRKLDPRDCGWQIHCTSPTRLCGNTTLEPEHICCSRIHFAFHQSVWFGCRFNLQFFWAQHPGDQLDVVRKGFPAGEILSVNALDLWVAWAEVDSVLPSWPCWWWCTSPKWWLCQLFASMCLVVEESKCYEKFSLSPRHCRALVLHKWLLACGGLRMLRWSQLEVQSSMFVSPEGSCCVWSVSGLGFGSSGAEN